MRFIVGLGNPGPEYEHTRHNAGFMVADEILRPDLGWKTQDSSKFQAIVARNPNLTVIKPQTFMNNSGQSVRAILNFYGTHDLKPDQKLEELYVIHDDLDLELGTYKIQLGKGPKIHNGLLSMYDHLHTSNFWHVRIGVDGRQGDRSMPGHAYVLQPFQASEKPQLETVIKEVAQKLLAHD